ncbi:MAG: Rieske (2Fe-2S) protein [Myxococcales bacterium]|nr:Rieske (2Fe-2S) protein [Myxococcales bacterium]
MSDQKNVSEARRRFLFRASAAAAAAGVVFPACGMPMTGNDGGVDSGTGDTGTGSGSEFATGVMASSLSVGSVQVVTPTRGDPVVLGRDAGGYYAMSGACTHEMCPVMAAAGASMIGCTCNHGATYSLTGALLTPATTRPVANQQPLKHFRMEIRAGAIVVSVGTEVPNTTRVTA